MSLDDFSGRTVIITGAASGIGRATAVQFGGSGANLVLVDRDGPRLAEAEEELRASDVSTRSLSGDVSDPRTAELAVGLAASEFGRCDILVNNAGLAFMATVLDTTPEQWDHVFAVNTKSAFMFSRQAIPAIIATGGGAVVNIASEAGLVGFLDYAAYSASKAALVNLTRSMALDHAQSRVRVNCICPGSIETPLLQRYFNAQEDPEKSRAADELAHPLGLGLPDDIANGVLFLASDRARYITGHALVIDGGYTAQ